MDSLEYLQEMGNLLLKRGVFGASVWSQYTAGNVLRDR
ncbi:MAG: hypothetical protein CM15mP12_1070 [Gammaproteobacteria bacterium]|nr:MAG: hypothetical protein CM15mP12_1070 [Gammaproteobacteria bacterium]